jgi:drug/metabolite transporter (DMT)-like permease
MPDPSPTIPPAKESAGWLAGLLISVAPLCWAGNIVLARGVIDLIPPVAFAFWRWMIAFVLLLPFAWRRAHQDWSAVVEHWKIMAFLSFTGITCFNTLLYTAVHTTTAINGALIQTTMPAVIVVLSITLFRDKVGSLQILGVVLCMVGAGWVVVRGNLSTLIGMSFVQGDLLMCIAVVLYALYSAFLRKRPPIHPMSFLVYTFGFGALGLLPLYLAEWRSVGSFPLDRDVLLSILYVAVFPSIVAYFCWNRGIERLGANRGGLFINLIPVFASLMAVGWLGESLKGFHVAGMALIFSGLILFNRKKAAPVSPRSSG